MRNPTLVLAALASLAFSTACGRDTDEEQTECRTDADCTEDGAAFCDTDGGECVACLEAAHCDEGDACVANVCEPAIAVDCDVEGFTAVAQEGFYAVGSDGPVVGYVGETGTEPPVDRVRVSWWFDWGADWNGVGVYPVETGSNLADCGLCVEIYRFDAAGQLEALFFATEGEIEVTAVGGDGEPFEGVLRNVVLLEWDVDEDGPVTGGRTWCVAEHAWATAMDGQLPCEADADCADGLRCETGTGQCVACLGHGDCDGDLPYCDTDENTCIQCIGDNDCSAAGQVCNLPTGTCVECNTIAECGTDEVCAANACLDVSTCTTDGFEPVEQSTTNLDFFGTRLLFYRATDASENTLRIDMLGDAQPPPTFAPGTTEIGAHPSDQNFGTCATCVLIAAGCDDAGEGCDYYFAVAGELEVDVLGTDDGDTFAGTLRDAYLQQVTLDEETGRSTPVEGGGLWCVSSLAFSSYLNVDCLDETDCDGDLFCSDAGACVECLDDTHCTIDGEACLDNVCRVPPEGNRCDDAIVIDAAQTVTGDMVGYTNDFSPGTNETSCTGFGAAGPDVVFVVTLEPGETLEVTYTLTAGDGSLYIVSDCLEGDPPVDHAAVCLDGADDTLSGEAEEVSHTNAGTESETVWVVLDAYAPPSDPEAATWEAVFNVTP